MDFLAGTPYSLSHTAQANITDDIEALAERVALLRRQGELTADTLALYFGQTRFEQIAESNALEGSTLDVGETELAVIKGVTLSSHDPGHVRDAQTLATALEHLTVLATEQRPTTLEDVLALHERILAGQHGAGLFRREEVRLRGSKHRPPRTWSEVMAQMEQWERWSQDQATLPAPWRAMVLHAWLTHVHPFVDGNGRTARAVGNLELIRGGYPSIIIRRRKDRDRYLDALARSDEAGDLAEFADLVLERLRDALRDLESAAKRGQDYSVARERVRKAQEKRLGIWTFAVGYLLQHIADEASRLGEALGATVETRLYDDSLSLDDFIELCEGRSVSRSWAFSVEVALPALPKQKRLCWQGYTSTAMQAARPANAAAFPSLFWSRPNPQGYPPWQKLQGADAPGGDEITLVGDRWWVLRDENARECSIVELARQIADDMVALCTR
jgi:Fic family protein